MITDAVTYYRLLSVLAFAGLLIAGLSILETRVKWIASFCAFFGEGCRRTADFTLFRLPVSWWGVTYYLFLALAVYWAKPLVFWAVMAGFGFELTFVWIMASTRALCIFCLLNAFTMSSLFLLAFDRSRIWQAISVVLLFFISSKYLLARENRLETSTRPENKELSVIAKIDGQVVTAEHLERPLAHRIYDLETDIHQLKRKRLDEIIDNALLQKDAEQKGLSVQQLIDSILARQEGVTDEEIEAHYEKNQRRRERWTGSEEEFRNRMKAFLQKRKAQEAVKDYASSLRDRFDVEVFLEEPPLPFTNVSPENSPVLGEADAPVKIIEFSDYLCPDCRAEHSVVNRIKEIYGEKIQWVFKDFPLEMHNGAKKLAEAARCAGDQGKYWEYQDLLFGAEEKPDLEQLINYAERLGLETEQFGQCLENGAHLPEVEENVESGKEAGVNSTPTFIINGRLKSGTPSVEEFKQMIDEELKRANIQI